MARLVKKESAPAGSAFDRWELPEVFGPIDRAFEHLFGTWLTSMPARRRLDSATHWLSDLMIPVDEFHRNGSLVIHAEIPGIDPDEDVELTVSDGMLHIVAHREAETNLEEGKFVRQEMRYGSFERMLPLPAGVMESDITASYKDGILEVVVPEGEKAEVKTIAITKE